MPPAKLLASRAFAAEGSIDADIMRRPYRAFAAKGTGQQPEAILIERPSPEFREGRQPRCGCSAPHRSLPASEPSAWGPKVREAGARHAALMKYVIPMSFLAIPFYGIMGKYGMTDNPLEVIAVEVTFATPYAIFIFQQYSASIPYELDEAARIDGASAPQIFLLIYLPLMAPALVAIGTYALLLSWNEYLYAFLLLSNPVVTQLPAPACCGGRQELCTNLGKIASSRGGGACRSYARCEPQLICCKRHAPYGLINVEGRMAILRHLHSCASHARCPLCPRSGDDHEIRPLCPEACVGSLGDHADGPGPLCARVSSAAHNPDCALARRRSHRRPVSSTGAEAR